MQVEILKEVTERTPFRPFSVRLNNGAEYEFKEARDFGAPRDYRCIIFFGDHEWALIDTESIAEVIVR
jgi:hypothetical protein